MSQEWMALVRQLCTPQQELAITTIAGAADRSGPTTADVAELARRFGMSSTEADAWSRGALAESVHEWPGEAVELVAPDGLFEEIGLDDTVAVVNRLARALTAA
ncbi:hypothetical protein NOCA2550017 [metagenome]|uniref:Uncharacterized protein n=1 Tax=metagenome TaxID=256318 RepID=A0A2P2CAD4_9ZZZZ